MFTFFCSCTVTEEIQLSTYWNHFANSASILQTWRHYLQNTSENTAGGRYQPKYIREHEQSNHVSYVLGTRENNEADHVIRDNLHKYTRENTAITRNGNDYTRARRR